MTHKLNAASIAQLQREMATFEQKDSVQHLSRQNITFSPIYLSFVNHVIFTRSGESKSPRERI